MERAAARAGIWTIVVVLLLTVVVFAVLRFVVDVPQLVGGTVPDEDSFDYRYVTYPWLAYTHFLPGLVYLLLAPIQLWRGFRNRHLKWHRRIGRVALTAGLISGVFAIAFGALFSWGGVVQAIASVTFGAWFMFALATAYRAIRRRDIRTHRRWMIRAFAVGLAVGTIRIWIGLFEGFGILEGRDAFGVAFWLSFLLHAAVAELYLWWRPSASGAPRTAEPSVTA